MATIGSEASHPPTIGRPKPIRWGDTVFFKVEELIFEVPRHRFAETSQVFKDMFLLPVGDGQEEGRSEERPIVLDGYKAIEFNALIKALYPTPHDVISGSYTLTKEEWIGVLNLSTRWDMKEIRKHTIQELTKLLLKMNPVEKVVLARECKVAKWFQEGLNELVTERPVRPLVELKSQLGLDTACTLLWVRSQTSDNGGLLFTLGSIRCGCCKAAIFAKSCNCSSCHQEIRIDDCADLYIGQAKSIVGVITTTAGISGPALMEPFISQKLLRCRKCNDCPFSTDLQCPSCSSGVMNPNVYFGLAHATSNNSNRMILEEFRDEIAMYESADQE